MARSGQVWPPWGVPQGTFKACKVASERPAGLEFGAAALKLAPRYALKPGAANDGRLPVVGGQASIPARYRLQDPEPAEPAATK